MEDAVGADELSSHGGFDVGGRGFNVGHRGFNVDHRGLDVGRRQGRRNWMHPLLNLVPLGRGAPLQMGLAEHEDLPCNIGNSLCLGPRCITDKTGSPDHGLGDILVVFSAHLGHRLEECIPVELVRTGAKGGKQDHDGIEPLAVVEVTRQPDEVVLQAGSATDGVLQVSPNRIRVVLEGLWEVFALDDFEEGEEGDGAAANGHVGGDAVGKSTLEEVDLISMSLKYDDNGLEEGIRASGR